MQVNPHAYTVPTGDELRAVRHAIGLSQDELAELAGTGQTTISKLENGPEGTTVTTLVTVIETLRGEWDEKQLAEADGHNPRAPQTHHPVTNGRRSVGHDSV